MHTSIHSEAPETSGIPHAMVLRIIRALPGDEFPFVTVTPRIAWDGMGEGRHLFPKNGSKTFFAEGLDRNSQPPPGRANHLMQDELEQSAAQRFLDPHQGYRDRLVLCF
jgi:hypothetical protein